MLYAIIFIFGSATSAQVVGPFDSSITCQATAESRAKWAQQSGRDVRAVCTTPELTAANLRSARCLEVRRVPAVGPLPAETQLVCLQ